MREPEPTIDRHLPIARIVEILEQTSPSSPLHRNVAKLLDAKLAPARACVPEPTPQGPARFLTIGMATYDDYDGVYFSAQAIRLFHPEITAHSEILVLDNNPFGPCAGALKKLETYIPGYRYIPYASSHGTSVKDCLFREAKSAFVLSMDCHVLFAPGSLARLISFLERQPESKDLWHGPMLGDELTNLQAQFDPVWSGGMYGAWGQDERAADPDAPPFEIPMQGTGVFACRTQAWPGFNPRFSGFGGEEGYIHEKTRQHGGKVFCLPFLRWLHRFERPMGIPYRPVWKDRIRNYLIGWNELRLDAAPVVEHFVQLLGEEQARPILESVQREIGGPFHSFSAVYSIGPDRNTARWSALDLDSKMRFFPVIDTPYCPRIGGALAHRSILDEADRQDLENVLVFEQSFDFSPAALDAFYAALSSSTGADWLACPLPHAVAYRRAVFKQLLDELPETPSGMALWLKRHGTLEAYYMKSLAQATSKP